MTGFLTIGALNKGIKTKKKFADNYFHSIFRLFDVLPNFSFNMSETKRDYS